MISRGAASLAAFALFASPGAARAAPPPANGAVKVDVALGKGLTVRDAADVASLNLRFRVQTQGAVETNEPDATTGERAPADVAFQIRRARVLLQGHVLSKAVRYYVQFGFSRLDQEPDLLVPVRDAFVEWQELRDVRLRFGQGKVPFSRERVVSSSALELVDRSNVNAELNLDRDVGVTVFSKDFLGAGERLRYSAGLYGGDGRNRVSGMSGFLWAARVEALPFGDFDDYVGADLAKATRPKLAFGVATATNSNTVRALSTLGPTYESGTVDYRHGTADAVFKWRGVSVTGSVLVRRADRTVVGELPDEDGDGEPEVEMPRSAWGFVGSVGALVFPRVDASLRYGEVRPFDDAGPMDRDREIGGGLGWFVMGHDLKIQADYFRLLFDRDDDLAARDRVRVQTQIYF